MNQPLIQTLAYVISQLGYSVAGGKEVFISDEKLAAIPKEAQVQVVRNPENTGYNIRYLSNRILDIETVKNDAPSNGRLVQHSQANDSISTSVVDSVRDSGSGEVSETDGEET
jgi:hypothetical protein